MSEASNPPSDSSASERPVERPAAAIEASSLTVTQKQAANVWDHIDDVLPVIELARAGKWVWFENSRCKYIEIRIDLRDGGCILKDREGQRIDPATLRHQYEGKHQYAPWAPERAPLGDWQVEAAIACSPASVSKPPLSNRMTKQKSEPHDDQ